MISIIIPACNEEKYLESTTNSIRKQNFKNYEIIVVCDGCTDKTDKIAKKLADKTIVLKKRQGPAIAKNEGAKISKYKKLVFLDADTHLTKDALENISRTLDQNPNIVGTCKIRPSNNKIKHRLCYFLKNYLVCPFGVSNGLIFCTKETFIRFRGFNEKLKKGEDGDFVRRIKADSKFMIVNEYVINSTRRFDKKGYLVMGIYWVKEAIKPSEEHYELVR